MQLGVVMHSEQLGSSSSLDPGAPTEEMWREIIEQEQEEKRLRQQQENRIIGPWLIYERKFYLLRMILFLVAFHQT